MHNAAFAQLGIDARYELCPLEPSELDGFFVAAHGSEWLGFQVTAPYKEEAIRRCDAIEPGARRIGAVNSVARRSDGTLVGFNTDAPGFARSVRNDLGRDLSGLAVAVAGAGGAARAVVDASLEAGAVKVVVGNRSRERAKALVDSFADARLEAMDLGPEFNAWLPSIDLAVNATTVGMTSPGMSFDPGLLPGESSVFDLVYVPAETPLMAAARTVGVSAINGAGMLVAQAEIAFERWTGASGVGPVMRAAVEPLLMRDARP